MMLAKKAKSSLNRPGRKFSRSVYRLVTHSAEVASLAIAGAEKILETSVDAKAHSEMLEKLAAEL